MDSKQENIVSRKDWCEYLKKTSPPRPSCPPTNPIQRGERKHITNITCMTRRLPKTPETKNATRGNGSLLPSTPPSTPRVVRQIPLCGLQTLRTHHAADGAPAFVLVDFAPLATVQPLHGHAAAAKSSGSRGTR